MITQEIHRRIQWLKHQQENDGSWRYCFEGPVTPDAYALIFLSKINRSRASRYVHLLVERLTSKQNDDGSWSAYPGDGGDLSSTVEAYTALLYSGTSKQQENMQKAAYFIRQNGGLSKTILLTRVFLAFNGHLAWPKLPFNPTYLLLLPKHSPFNFYDISSFARIHLAPLFLGMSRNYQFTTKNDPDLSDLNPNKERINVWPEVRNERLFSTFLQLMKSVSHVPKQTAERTVEKYIVSHIEPDGTLLSYVSSTILMVLGLYAIGYNQNSVIVTRAIDALHAFLCKPNNYEIHMQNSPSTIWDTALITYSLLEANVSPSEPTIVKAGDFIQSQQQTRYGDWALHNPEIQPGGWGFSLDNTIHPDNDDTQASLRTMWYMKKNNKRYENSYNKGLRWLISMQNDDGGWGAFEKNVSSTLVHLIPVKNAKDALTDRSTADITGRTLQLIGSNEDITEHTSVVEKAVSWLESNQESNGSWFGRWGVCYIYGTWAAITGLSSVGSHHSIKKGCNWLYSIQHENGGWGESCKSDEVKKFVPLFFSTISQTAWALDALISANEKTNESIERGIRFLCNEPTPDQYPVGEGLAGAFYIDYHSYHYVWPLLTLAHYQQKYHS